MKHVKNFFIVFGLFLLSQVCLTVYTVIKIFDQRFSQTTLPTLTVVILIALNIIITAIMILIAYKIDVWKMNFKWISKKNIGIILISFVFCRIVGVLGTLLVQMQSGQETTVNDAVLRNMFADENKILIVLMLGIIPPIMEEIVFRGGIIGLLFKQRPWIGIIISSAIFGLMHTATSIIEFLLYAMMGFVMALAYYKSKRLEVSIAIHFLNNFLSVIAMLAYGMI